MTTMTVSIDLESALKGPAIPAAGSAQGAGASLSAMAGHLGQTQPEAVEQFAAAMAKPFADNTAFQAVLQTIAGAGCEAPADGAVATDAAVAGVALPAAADAGLVGSARRADRGGLGEAALPVSGREVPMADAAAAGTAGMVGSARRADRSGLGEAALPVPGREVPMADAAVVGVRGGLGEAALSVAGSEMPAADAAVADLAGMVGSASRADRGGLGEAALPVPGREVPVADAAVAGREVPVPAADDADPEALVTAETLVAAGYAPQAPMAAEATVASASAAEIAGVRTVELSSAARATLSVSEVLVAAAEAVADAILVSPGLMRGEGEVRIQLRPDVLDGTEVRIAVQGRELNVAFVPPTADAAALIERCHPQLEQYLASRIHAFHVGVSVRGAGRSGRLRDEARV